VTRKITATAAKIKLGLENRLALGNIESKQDWGYAPDYVKAMWLMLQADNPQDYIMATGKLHTVEDICKIAFSTLGLDYKKFVVLDKSFYRKVEGKNYCGDASKAWENLHWKPEVTFEKMIKIMTESDYQKMLKMKGKA
jgi:GDPmannose 4,6-dehydratase